VLKSGVPRLAAGGLCAGLFLASAGCAAALSHTPPPAGKPGAYGSSGVASPTVTGCPITLAEAHAAVPKLISGPGIGLTFKNETADCSFASSELDVQGRPAGILILVFDAQGAGRHMWDSARTDPNFPNRTPVSGVGDDAFVTGATRFTDLFAVKGQVALHISTLLPGGLSATQFGELARAAFARLDDPGS
jgi:hypothetical protein